MSGRITRRGALAALVAGPLSGCSPRHEPAWTGGWVGASHERGHRVRDLGKSGAWPAPAVSRRSQVLVVGGGVAGLACARELAVRGLDDVHVLELEPAAGGNSRGHRLGGMLCPLGAHYLPTPASDNTDLLALLQALGLCRRESGRWVFDERHLCHAPQERLFYEGQWREGLLPGDPDDTALQAAWRALAAAVQSAKAEAGFSLPTARQAWSTAHEALDRLTFVAWLDAKGLTHPDLRAFLDYCCRDDYGAGIAQVSAWAGLHYFASRHGFHPPGADAATPAEAVLTWPEGNGWLTARMAAPLGARLHTDRVVLRVDEGRHALAVDAWNAQAGHVERWTASHVVMATPLFVAARLLAQAPPALAQAAAQLRYAPWLVANLHLSDRLYEPPGTVASWDNVVHGSALLGYVDATHQFTHADPGAPVLTAYWALGGDCADDLKAQRSRLLTTDWAPWAEAVVREMAVAHPDLPFKVKQADLMRYGHAMSVPIPGVRGSAALRALQQPSAGRVAFAHSDLSGYSVFEEAFAQGLRAARAILSSGLRSVPVPRPGQPPSGAMVS